MLPQDIAYLEKALSTFIDSSIARLRTSGAVEYTYCIQASEIKAATSRKRLHTSVFSDYAKFFINNKVGVAYDPYFQVFRVNLHLQRCILTPDQLKARTKAVASFNSH